MLRFYKEYNDGSPEKEITYSEALETLLTTYRDNDMTRDMLTIPNRIHCLYSTVNVEDYYSDTEIKVLMAGYWNMLPMGIEYDDDGNRIPEGN